jgi:glycosyltransferase involved in cell wall biosynthesis
MSISIITPVYNDFAAFYSTLQSILLVKSDFDFELVVVDSSSKLESSRIKQVLSSSGLFYKYSWIKPDGVYSALNHGVTLASKIWIQVLNSGDMIVPDAELYWSRCIDSEVDIYVYSQGWSVGGVDGIHYPSSRSVWGHQSILYKRKLHDEYGLYREDLKIVSDQIFFWGIRSKVKYKIYHEILSHYDMGGISSRITIENCKEIYFFHRYCGLTIGQSFMRGYIYPMVKFFLGRSGYGRIKSYLDRV